MKYIIRHKRTVLLLRDSGFVIIYLICYLDGAAGRLVHSEIADLGYGCAVTDKQTIQR